MSEEPNCVITIDGKKHKIKANSLKELMEWTKKRGISDIKIQEMTFFVPEINKHIHMVAKHRPDISISPDGMMLYSTTALTPKEVEIIKKTRPELGPLFMFIEEEKKDYVV